MQVPFLYVHIYVSAPLLGDAVPPDPIYLYPAPSW